MYVIKLCSICVANFRITFSMSSLYASRLELAKTGLAQYLEGREKVVATTIWNSFHKQAQRQTEAEIHSMCHGVLWLPCSTSNFASWFLAVAPDTNSGSDPPLDTWLWTHRGCGLFIGTVFLSEKWKSLVVQSCLTLWGPMDSWPCQAPLSMGFSRQEEWSELLFPPPRNLPETRIEPGSPALQANSLQSNPDLSQATVFHRTLHKFPLPVPTWGQDICGFLNWLIVNSRSELPTSLLNSSLPQISHNST